MRKMVIDFALGYAILYFVVENLERSVGGTGRPQKVPQEVIKTKKILAPNNENIEWVVAAFNVSSQHHSAKRQRPEPSNI